MRFLALSTPFLYPTPPSTSHQYSKTSSSNTPSLVPPPLNYPNQSRIVNSPRSRPGVIGCWYGSRRREDDLPFASRFFHREFSSLFYLLFSIVLLELSSNTYSLLLVFMLSVYFFEIWLQLVNFYYCRNFVLQLCRFLFTILSLAPNVYSMYKLS
ncbi:hypothetical protein ABFX02_04G102000 [Erythranthe guttata]